MFGTRRSDVFGRGESGGTGRDRRRSVRGMEGQAAGLAVALDRTAVVGVNEASRYDDNGEGQQGQGRESRGGLTKALSHPEARVVPLPTRGQARRALTPR